MRNMNEVMAIKPIIPVDMRMSKQMESINHFNAECRQRTAIGDANWNEPLVDWEDGVKYNTVATKKKPLTKPLLMAKQIQNLINEKF